MKSQKGFAPIVIILVVVALLGIGVGGYYVWSQQLKEVSLQPPAVEKQSEQQPAIQNEKVPSQTEKPATLPMETQKPTVTKPEIVAEPKVIVCGNGMCEQGENAVSCPEDCSVGLEKIALYQSDLPLIQNVEWRHVGGNGFSTDSFLDNSMRGFGLLAGMVIEFEL